MNPQDAPPVWNSGEALGRVCLEICQGSACREVGNEDLLAQLERLSGLRRDRVAPDGGLALVAGICQGRCAIGPNVRLNGHAFSIAGPSEAHGLYLKASKLASKAVKNFGEAL